MNELKPIEQKNQRVLLTSQLAERYGTTPDVITKNYNRNKDRYCENKDYYLLQGEHLKEFRAKGQIDLSPNLNKLYLWTEHGALLHAKSLGTDEAWEVYTELVNTYFRARGNTSRVPFSEYIQSVGITADILRVNEPSKVSMLGKAYKSYNLPADFLPTYVEGRVKSSASDLLKKNDSPFRAVTFNQKMKAAGFLEQKTRPSKSKGEHKFWSVTEAGKKYGENQVSPNNPRETQPLYYEDTFAELLERI